MEEHKIPEAHTALEEKASASKREQTLLDEPLLTAEQSPQNKRRKKPAEIPTLEQIETERARLRYRRRYSRALRSTIYVLVIVAAAAVIITMLFMPVVQISGTSMEPTLDNGDIIVLNKVGDYEVGDLCGFYWQNELLIKRVIGLPGDYIDIKEDGTVFVNGEELDEPYLVDKALGHCDLELPYQVPENHYFLVGDLRSTSIDSRSSNIGAIDKSQLIGHVLFRVWPLKKISRIE